MSVVVVVSKAIETNTPTGVPISIHLDTVESSEKERWIMRPVEKRKLTASTS